METDSPPSVEKLAGYTFALDGALKLKRGHFCFLHFLLVSFKEKGRLLLFSFVTCHFEQQGRLLLLLPKSLVGTTDVVSNQFGGSPSLSCTVSEEWIA